MLMNNNEYLDLVQTIKQEIQQAQYKATLSVNKELIMLYYNIGKIINEHKSWGNKFIENLAADIKLSFPNAKGYSVRNLKYMSKFASTYPDEQFVQTVSAQIPWSHNVAILDKVKGEKQREWYIRKTAENGWSHNVLIHQNRIFQLHSNFLQNTVSLFPIRLSFNSQQFHIVIELISISRLKHYPFPVTISCCFIILPANGIRKSFPYLLKFYSFIFSKDNHKTKAILFRI